LRSVAGLFEQVWAFEPLLTAWKLAARGKRSRINVCAFEAVWLERLLALSDSLRDGHWRPGKYRSFLFEEHGKRRLISAAPFPDRIVHHAITAVLEPVWERRFLPWSFANRRGRGTHEAMRHAFRGVQRFRYSLQLDIRRFFPSIDHELLKGLVARHVREERLLELVGLVIDSGAGLLASEWLPVLFPGDDLLSLTRAKGMPIGNQTSQFLANVMLHPVDLCIAHEFKPGLAARYVDDLVLFDDDFGKLRAAQERLTEKLAELRLVPHPRKTQLRSTKDGLTFVGYRLTRQGVRLPRETVTRFRRTLRSIAEAYCADGELDLAQVKQRVCGLLGHAAPGHIQGVMAQMLNDVPFVRRS
jgi:RNA-directed DNA polymerase